jgi:hypothetical protein
MLKYSDFNSNQTVVTGPLCVNTGIHLYPLLERKSQNIYFFSNRKTFLTKLVYEKKAHFFHNHYGIRDN